MKEKLYHLLTTPGDLSTEAIVLNILMAAIIGSVICLSYMLTHRGTIYSRKFNVSLLILTILTGTVMTVIGNNIALSLGMVGALSIVRFRTAIKDSRDTIYIFWTIIVGICCGVGDYMVAAIGSTIVFLAFLLLGAIKNDNRMLLIVRAARNRQTSIQSLVFQFFNHKAILRVRNTTDSTVEFIFEVPSTLLEKSEIQNGSIIDSIYELGGVEYVNVVMQNDEISN